MASVEEVMLDSYSKPAAYFMSAVINETPVFLVLICLLQFLWLTFHMIKYYLFIQDFISPFPPLFIYFFLKWYPLFFW